MTLLCRARVVALLFSILLLVSCGDTFRPIVIPNPPTPPDSSNFRAVFVVNSNGLANPGTGMQIDVSGDSDVGTAKVGLGPVHAAVQPTGTAHVFVANSLDDTVASFAPAPPCFVLPCSVTGVGSVVFSTLPAGSVPVFVHTTENSTVYVANSGNATVAAISITSNVVTNIIPVGTNPVALAETPDARKLYAVNQGDSSVTSINPLNKTVNTTITDPSISSPVWALARADGGRIYVLSQGNGDVAVIDPNTDALVNPGTPVSAGAGANFMAYEKNSNRVYITNPTAGTLTVLNAAVDPPNNVLAALSFLPAAPRTDASGNPLTCTGAVAPVSVTALPDGTRAYVAGLFVGTCQNAAITLTCVSTSTNQPSGVNICPQVTVINASDNGIRSSVALSPIPVAPAIPVSSFCDLARFRLSTASAGDSSRVYVASCDAGSVAIIRTSDDTALQNPLPAPVSAANPPGPGLPPPPQNPVFVIAGP